MSDQADNYLNLVKPYGLSEEEGSIYLHLLEHGFATALTLSRQLHLARTKVYRLLDKLIAKQLVEQKLDGRGLQFGATSPQKFHQIVEEKQQQLKALKNSLPKLVTQLQQLIPQNTLESKVLYYEGVEGLKQVSYNITHAKDVVRVFEMEHLSDFVPVEFAERVRRELVEKQIHVRDLTNKSSFPGYTDVTDLIEKLAESRYISPEKLKINFEVLIYNDIYATYTYGPNASDDEIFCVEIHNAQLAAMQKQIFDFIWEQAQPMKFLDKRGAATI